MVAEDRIEGAVILPIRPAKSFIESGIDIREFAVRTLLNDPLERQSGPKYVPVVMIWSILEMHAALDLWRRTGAKHGNVQKR